MSNWDNVSIIIPSLNPTVKLASVVTGLVEAGFGDIIVIDDGSDRAHIGHFEMIRGLRGCTVLTHTRNMGKGAALKTAFSFFQHARSGKCGAVTVDGDGQHLRDDIVKCSLALTQSDKSVVLGVRDFNSPTVPKRNSFGNRAAAYAFRTLFGFRLHDTQTGLRGIPAPFIPLMLEIPGARFEYETNMLLELKRRGVPFHEIDIETVYEIGANDHSHYRPFTDSVIIFGRIIRYVFMKKLY